MTLRFAAAGLAVITALLSGCASPPQTPIALGASTVGPQGGRVGVAMTALPKVDTFFPGADCLLCIATASMANSSLTKHARTLPLEDLPKLKDTLAGHLRGKGAEVVVIADDLKIDDLPNAPAEGPNLARKDFTGLRKKLGVDKLLVVSLTQIGFERTYSSYIPTADPKALVRGAGFLVNLQTNAYEWYQPVNILRSADGAWDEPEKFPGLSNAYFQAVELGKDQFVKPFQP